MRVSPRTDVCSLDGVLKTTEPNQARTDAFLPLPQIGEDRMDIKSKLGRQLLTYLTYLGDDGVFPHHIHVPINSSGVQISGICSADRSQTRAILRMIWAFAKWLQFQVSR